MIKKISCDTESAIFRTYYRILCITCSFIPDKKNLHRILDCKDKNTVLEDLVEASKKIEESHLNFDDPSKFTYALLWSKAIYHICKMRYKKQKENKKKNQNPTNEKNMRQISYVFKSEMEGLEKAEQFFDEHNFRRM